MARCRHIKASGEPCRAAALRGEDCCLYHSPERQEEVAEARRLGGLRRRREKTVSVAYDFEGLRSVPDILRVLESAVSDTLALESSVPRSRALAHLCEISRRCLERDQEERIRRLESMVRSYQLGEPFMVDEDLDRLAEED